MLCFNELPVKTGKSIVAGSLLGSGHLKAEWAKS